MRIHLSTTYALWLCIWLQLQYMETQAKKPRFGMFFQMKRHKDNDNTSTSESSLTEPSMEQVCVDQTALQAQLDQVKARLQEKEQETFKERNNLTDQLQVLQKKLTEAEKKLDKLAPVKAKSVASQLDSTDELDQRLAAERDKLATEWKSKFAVQDKEWQSRYADLQAQIESLQRQAEESYGKIEVLNAQLDESQLALNNLRATANEKEANWEEDKHKLMDLQITTEQELLQTKKVMADYEEFSKNAAKEASYWKTSFEHRSYINGTHVLEFASVLTDLATAPAFEYVRAIYEEHFKEQLFAMIHWTYSIYDSHLAPHYDKFVRPVYNEFLADKVDRAKASAGLVEDAVPQAVSSIWAFIKERATQGLSSYCQTSLTLVNDEKIRSKIHAACEDTEPIISTLLAIPLVLVLGRFLFWLAMLPINLLLLISPLRFGKIDVNDEEPKPVSLDANVEVRK